jgi:hypothetical protein
MIGTELDKLRSIMKIHPEKALQLVILLVLLFVFALQIGSFSRALRPQSSQPNTSQEASGGITIFGAKPAQILKILEAPPKPIPSIANVFFAMLIGFAGAMAFYAGVYFGFIAPESRNDITKYIVSTKSISIFAMLGGVVAGVFQWAQPDVLAPIQAFVLGATWPSVVTRIMSGSPSAPPPPTAAAIVTPVTSAVGGGQASKAEVLINP